MTLQYILDSRLQDYANLLGDYQGWYRSVLEILCYPETLSDDRFRMPVLPVAYMDWLQVLEGHDYVTNDEFNRMIGLQGQMLKMAEVLVSQVSSSRQKVSADQYKGFSVLYNEFAKLIQSVDRRVRIEAVGVDTLTGLRTQKAMIADIERELEKLERQGIPFTVAMVKIDFYRQLKQNEGEEGARHYQQAVAQTLLEALRSYDDGYRLHNGEFLLCMKQSDLHGGVAALQRLYTLLAEKGISIEVDGKIRALTLSSCIAEPIPEDNVDRLLEYLREDLKNAKEGTGSLLAYAEITPIERYYLSVEEDMKKARHMDAADYSRDDMSGKSY